MSTFPRARELTLHSGTLRLAALLFLPDDTPHGALLVCHGAGSCKENHAIMARQAVARGLAALVFDFRGHGQSEGIMDAHAADDVVAAARSLLDESGAPWLAARGSSLGAFWLLHAAHAHPSLFRSLVILCPADEASLLRGLDRFESLTTDAAEQFTGRFDVAGLRTFLQTDRLLTVAAGQRRVLVAHARDDTDVPFATSERLASALAPPMRLIALPSGGHKAPQRSADVARATLDWVISQAVGLPLDQRQETVSHTANKQRDAEDSDRQQERCPPADLATQHSDR